MDAPANPPRDLPQSAPRRPLLGALAVVLHEGHALLVQRGKASGYGLWGFPGGHVEWGETAQEAAIRELHEETALRAESLGYLTNVDFISAGADGQPEVHYLLAAVLCRYTGGTPVAGDDAAAVAWVPFDDIAKRTLQMSDRVPDVLAAALERLG